MCENSSTTWKIFKQKLGLHCRIPAGSVWGLVHKSPSFFSDIPPSPSLFFSFCPHCSPIFPQFSYSSLCFLLWFYKLSNSISLYCFLFCESLSSYHFFFVDYAQLWLIAKVCVTSFLFCHNVSILVLGSCFIWPG